MFPLSTKDRTAAISNLNLQAGIVLVSGVKPVAPLLVVSLFGHFNEMGKRVKVNIDGKWFRFHKSSVRFVEELPNGCALVRVGNLEGYISPTDKEIINKNAEMAREFQEFLRKLI